MTFVGIALAPGVDALAALAHLRDQIGPWDPTGYPVLRYSKPIRPPEIINARSVALPFVGGLLVLAATIGLAVAIVISVRARRRRWRCCDLGVHQPATARVSVGQALAMMLGGFVVGAPLGIAVGRLAWRAFASPLGVVTVTSTPIVWVVRYRSRRHDVAALAAAGTGASRRVRSPR